MRVNLHIDPEVYPEVAREVSGMRPKQRAQRLLLLMHMGAQARHSSVTPAAGDTPVPVRPRAAAAVDDDRVTDSFAKGMDTMVDSLDIL